MAGAADPRRPRKRQGRTPAVADPPADEDKPFDEPVAPASPGAVPVEELAPAVDADDEATCEPPDEAAIPASDLN